MATALAVAFPATTTDASLRRLSADADFARSPLARQTIRRSAVWRHRTLA
jgi:hypothetical protein